MRRRLLVDLDKLAANYALFQQATVSPSARVAAVVKADGYGLGARAASRRLAEAGCRDFFVATADEALSLRAGLQLDPNARSLKIYVFEGAEPDSAADLAAAGIVPVFNDPRQLECWRPHKDLPIAAQIDTGLTRLGFPAEVTPSTFAGLDLELLLSHLACADQLNHPMNAVQSTRFADLKQRFPAVTLSLGNSAGWLTGAPLQAELGRPGIGLYGGNPFSDRPNPCAAVASLQGRVLQIKEIVSGDSVGYGATYVATEPRRVAVVALGYADGVPRQLSGQGELAFAGQRAPLLGRVSMDVSVADISGLNGVSVGDWAECFGDHIGIDEVARQAGTIAYEVLTGVGPRVERCYQQARG